jgi:hypothetical protein
LHTNPTKLVSATGTNHVIAPTILVNVHTALEAFSSFVLLFPFLSTIFAGNNSFFAQEFHVLFTTNIRVPLISGDSKTRNISLDGQEKRG